MGGGGWGLGGGGGQGTVFLNKSRKQAGHRQKRLNAFESVDADGPVT